MYTMTVVHKERDREAVWVYDMTTMLVKKGLRKVRAVTPGYWVESGT